MKRIFTTVAFLMLFGAINAQEQTTPGYTATGFYDDFATDQEYFDTGNTGIYWRGDDDQGSSVVRHEGYLEAKVDQVGPIEWNPLWISFGKNPNDIPHTIDLSNAAEIKTTITNENDEPFFIEFSFLLGNGEFIQFQDGLDGADQITQWEYMPQFDLPAYTTKEVVIDLTKGMGGNCFWNSTPGGTDPSCVQHFDMSKVVGMTYEIFHLNGGIMDAKFKVHSLKVGEIDGGEKDLITAVDSKEKQLVSVYPNPVQSQLSVSSKGALAVYSIEGQELFNSTVEEGEKIDVSSWSKGLYIVKLTNELGEFNTSFVKQ